MDNVLAYQNSSIAQGYLFGRNDQIEADGETVYVASTEWAIAVNRWIRENPHGMISAHLGDLYNTIADRNERAYLDSL
jgi:hypothetical protein